jgi:O-antigen/teichoic acid export membrane protein
MSHSRDELVSTAEAATHGALFLFSGQTLATVIAAVGSIIIARLLGPELYGVYSLSLVVPGFLLLFTDFGVGPALTWLSAKLRKDGSEGRLASMIRHAYAFEALTSAIVLFVGLALSDVLSAAVIRRPELAPLVRVAAFSILFNCILSASSSTLIGFNDMKGSALLNAMISVVRSVLSPLLIVLGFGALGAVVGYVSSYLLAAMTGALLVYFNHYRRLSSGAGSTFKGDLGTMLSYGSFLYLSGALGSMLGTYQGIILAWFTTNFVIGNFNVATILATLILLLTGPISTALFPAFSSLNPSGEEIKRMFKWAVKYSAMLVVPASVFIAIESKDIVRLIYGDAYSLAPTFLSFYCLAFLYAGLGSVVLGSFFNGIGQTKVNFNATAIRAIFFLPLAFLLTRSYSVPGLIGAILVSSLAPLIYCLWVASKRFGASLDLRGSLLIYASSFVSAIPALLLVAYSPFPPLGTLILSAMIYLMAYLTTMPLIGCIKSADVENLKMIFGKTRMLKPLVNVILSYENTLMRG